MTAAAMLGNTTIPVLEQVVNFSQARHNVLAGNVANLDTPGYRVRDLSPQRFQDLLKEAIQQRDTAPSTPFAGHDEASLRHVSDHLHSILYHDNSNVSVEHQVAEISKNQMQHNLALAILTSQFELLQAAISGRA